MIMISRAPSSFSSGKLSCEDNCNNLHMLQYEIGMSAMSLRMGVFHEQPGHAYLQQVACQVCLCQSEGAATSADLDSLCLCCCAGINCASLA